MARRASSSTSPLWFVAILVVAIGFVAGGYSIYSYLDDPLRTIPALPVATYLENSNSLRGNRYRVEAVVANQLGWSPEKGRLFSMEVDEGKEVIPLFVPAEFNALNLQKGQRYIFEVEVIEKGLLAAKGYQKV